ncbi:MAG: hypothetical protein HC902_06540 [Calothrix sp. SM1_5_4]|nr:hypothetical protein [Calothrix sp. SM1_5_4]
METNHSSGAVAFCMGGGLFSTAHGSGLYEGESISSFAAVNFETVKRVVFQNYCFRCHSTAGGNRGGVNLETYANVRPILAEIKWQVETGNMPADGPMPVSEQNLLLQWIADGAPEK